MDARAERDVAIVLTVEDDVVGELLLALGAEDPDAAAVTTESGGRSITMRPASTATL